MLVNFNENLSARNFDAILNDAEIRISDLLTTYEAYKEALADNEVVSVDRFALENAIKKANENAEKDFYHIAIFEAKPLEYLLNNPAFTVCRYDEDADAVTINNAKGNPLTRLAKVSNLEKAFQMKNPIFSNEAQKFLPDKSKTVFLTKRFYGLADCFIRHLFSRVLTVDNEKVVKLDAIKIDGVSVFTDKDGECFASNSYTKLQDQLNILVRFFGFDDVKMIKADVKILEAFVHKAKVNNNGYISITENDALKVADAILAQIRHKKNNVEYTIKAKANN